MIAIRKYRLLAGIATVREAARKLNVHESAVGKWERGIGKPKANRLPEIARLYGCTVDDLLTD